MNLPDANLYGTRLFSMYNIYLMNMWTKVLHVFCCIISIFVITEKNMEDYIILLHHKNRKALFCYLII